MRSGCRPSPKGTRLLFADAISLMMCPVDGLTEKDYTGTPYGRQERQEEGRDRVKKTKSAVLCPAGGQRTRQQTKRTAETKG